MDKPDLFVLFQGSGKLPDIENMKQTIDDDFNHVGVSLDNNFRCSRTPYENMEL